MSLNGIYANGHAGNALLYICVAQFINIFTGQTFTPCFSPGRCENRLPEQHFTEDRKKKKSTFDMSSRIGRSPNSAVDKKDCGNTKEPVPNFN